MESKMIAHVATASTTQSVIGARTSTGGANLPRDAGLYIVSTCATAGDAVALPSGHKSLAGAVKLVRNEGVARCDVYPGSILNTADPPTAVATSSVITTQVGAMANDEAYRLYPNQWVKFHSSDGLNWRVLDASPPSVIPLPDEAKVTVSLSESGSTFTVPAMSQACAVTLPAVKQGFRVRFHAKATVTADVTLTSGTANAITGVMMERKSDDSAFSRVTKGGTTTVVLKDVALQGAWIELESDGVVYAVRGVGTQTASFT